HLSTPGPRWLVEKPLALIELSFYRPSARPQPRHRRVEEHAEMEVTDQGLIMAVALIGEDLSADVEAAVRRARRRLARLGLRLTDLVPSLVSWPQGGTARPSSAAAPARG